MKFEQLLQVYWSKTFLYGGRTFSFNVTLSNFFPNLRGVSIKGRKNFIKRFEFNSLLWEKNKSLIELHLDKRKIINMYLSRITSINNNINELLRYNLIRLYLIKTYRGRCQALGKPARGQRTWSNAWNAYKCNRVLPLFIIEVKKNNPALSKPEKINFKKVKKKFKKSKIKIKMQIVKKKINLWF